MTPKRSTIWNLIFSVCFLGNRMWQMKINSGYKISQNAILKVPSSVQHVWETDLLSHVSFKSPSFLLYLSGQWKGINEMLIEWDWKGQNIVELFKKKMVIHLSQSLKFRMFKFVILWLLKSIVILTWNWIL